MRHLYIQNATPGLSCEFYRHQQRRLMCISGGLLLKLGVSEVRLEALKVKKDGRDLSGRVCSGSNAFSAPSVFQGGTDTQAQEECLAKLEVPRLSKSICVHVFLFFAGMVSFHRTNR